MTRSQHTYIGAAHVTTSRFEPGPWRALEAEAQRRGLSNNAMLNLILAERYGQWPITLPGQDPYEEAIRRLGGNL